MSIMMVSCLAKNTWFLGLNWSFCFIGDSILMLAAKGGSLKVLVSISPLWDFQKTEEILLCLFQKMKLNNLGLDLKERKNGNLTLFHFACFEGNLHILKYLLKIDELEGGAKQIV